MKIGVEGRLGILAAVTSLVLALVRHGIEREAGVWGGIEHVLGSWLVHFIAIFVLMFLASFFGTMLHEKIFGQRRTIDTLDPEFRYHVLMVLLVGSIAYFITANIRG